MFFHIKHLQQRQTFVEEFMEESAEELSPLHGLGTSLQTKFLQVANLTSEPSSKRWPSMQEYSTVDPRSRLVYVLEVFCTDGGMGHKSTI